MSPDLVFVAVTKGGNHVFGHIVGADAQGRPVIKLEALAEALGVFKDDIVSKVYVGWVPGYLDAERARFEQALQSHLSAWKDRIMLGHPRETLTMLAKDLEAHPEWLD